MRILTRKQLESWDLTWPDDDGGPWELSDKEVVKALGASRAAIGVYFIGYSDGSHKGFQLKYCGKAVDQPLFDRLKQHISDSSNSVIRDHMEGRNKTKVWFRFVEFSSRAMAEETEGLIITALLWNGRHVKPRFSGWNKRNEWTQHLASDW